MTVARRVLAIGLLLVGLGFVSVVYFDHGYDTWVRTEVSPPPGSVYAGDMTEAVFHQDEQRRARARLGRRTGLALFALGLIVAASALVALRRSQSDSTPRPAS